MYSNPFNKHASLSSRWIINFSRALSLTSFLRSHYDTLKVNPNASLKEVKDAYIKLSKRYHPDLHPNDPTCSERFIKLQEAYKILTNPDSRKNYDATLKNRTGYSYSTTRNPRRPYGYPDYTERDEWLRSDQTRREAHFRQEFSGNEFNRFYSKPHNLTPEELEKYFTYKKVVNKQKLVFILAGSTLMVVVFETILNIYWKEKKLHGANFSFYRGYRHSTNNYNNEFLQEITRRQHIAEKERQGNKASNSSITNNEKDL